MRIMKQSISLIMVAILCALSCSKKDSLYKSIRIGKESFGETISLNVGDTLITSLKSNPTTGYSWHVVKIDTGKVKLFDSSYNQDKPATPGNGGTEFFRFIAIDNTNGGKTELGLSYFRYGSMDTIPIDSFEVALRIEYMMPD